MTSFPPQDIRGFLLCCAGEWLTLRSRFALDGADRSMGGEGTGQAENGENAWHATERGELLVTFLEPEVSGEPGGLGISAPALGHGNPAHRQLIFSASGRFHSPPESADGEAKGERREEGTWVLRPDGSLQLTIQAGAAVVKERIWFTKPNLRLRSSVEHRADGRPGRASFSSEIRRVRPPQEPAAAPAP